MSFSMRNEQFLCFKVTDNFRFNASTCFTRQTCEFGIPEKIILFSRLSGIHYKSTIANITFVALCNVLYLFLRLYGIFTDFSISWLGFKMVLWLQSSSHSCFTLPEVGAKWRKYWRSARELMHQHHIESIVFDLVSPKLLRRQKCARVCFHFSAKFTGAIHPE